MQMITYQDSFKEQALGLILRIQNEEAKINLTLAEQPDLLDIPGCYLAKGGAFLLAVEDGQVIGTIAFMNYGNGNAVLKKFFVDARRRGTGVGRALYGALLMQLTAQGFRSVLLDTPEVARASHRFYERAGFVRIGRTELPFPYEFPDRNSRVYWLKLGEQ